MHDNWIYHQLWDFSPVFFVSTSFSSTDLPWNTLRSCFSFSGIDLIIIFLFRSSLIPGVATNHGCQLSWAAGYSSNIKRIVLTHSSDLTRMCVTCRASCLAQLTVDVLNSLLANMAIRTISSQKFFHRKADLTRVVFVCQRFFTLAMHVDSHRFKIVVRKTTVATKKEGTKTLAKI